MFFDGGFRSTSSRDLLCRVASGDLHQRGIDALLSKLNPGDRLIVGELSRLGRSLGQIIQIVDQLIKKNISFVAAKENIIIDGKKQDIQTKAMVAMFVGKFLMCTSVAYAGRYSYSLIRDIFASSGWVGGFASTILLIIIIYLLLQVDWTKFIETEMKKNS